MQILIGDAFDAKLPERLAPSERHSDMATLGEAKVLLVRSKTKVNAELLAQAPELKLVIRGGVGIDNVDKQVCAERGIKAMNTPRASSVAVAEMAMALMVAIPARLIEAHTSMKEGKFLKSELKRTELFKKTLGLIGAGHIATEVAKRAAGLRHGGDRLRSLPQGAPHRDDGEPRRAGRQGRCHQHPHAPDRRDPGHDQRRLPRQDEGRASSSSTPAAASAWWRPTSPPPCTAARCGPTAPTSGPATRPPADCPLLTAPNVFMAPHLGASSKENLGRIGDEVVAILQTSRRKRSTTKDAKAPRMQKSHFALRVAFLACLRVSSW